ncbi:hypothetical protein AVEN_15297-1 [Araneus ventricosus]|uniref:DDE-1 domain-containing protein n=1 Tax=Araneus ventricosus TaxID=182803 RepID=A0A4Y2JQU5_ARAVE|nr:hypothetical protein AVEN_15297-1 [Araneus ventricosus]
MVTSELSLTCCNLTASLHSCHDKFVASLLQTKIAIWGTSHCTVDGLKLIELVFLPPNSTCVLQPLDQGIIQNFKATYRKLLLQAVADWV